MAQIFKLGQHRIQINNDQGESEIQQIKLNLACMEFWKAETQLEEHTMF